MKKGNNNLICAIMLFVVLLSFFTFTPRIAFANESKITDDNLDTPEGDGTSSNPYIISADADKASFKFKPETMPFDFTVTTPGLYKVEYDSSGENNVIVEFTFITDNSSDIKVCINKGKWEHIDNWQLGIKTQKRDTPTNMLPDYEIIESSSYEEGDVGSRIASLFMRYDGSLTMNASYHEDLYSSGVIPPDDELDFSYYLANEVETIGDKEDKVVKRSVTLSNAMGKSSGGFDIEDFNLYYFTNNKRNRII